MFVDLPIVRVKSPIFAGEITIIHLLVVHPFRRPQACGGFISSALRGGTTRP
jgi:hypothetical protein